MEDLDPNEAARQELELLFGVPPPNQADATVELVKQFLERHPGICEHQNERGELPLHSALWCRSPLAILELFASAYPEALNCTTRLGNTPLQYACFISAPFDLKVFQLLATPATLLSRKDNVDRLPLHNYCSRGNGVDPALDAKVLEFLMGGDPNILLQVDTLGQTPLHCALSRVGVVAGDVPAIQWLINQCPPEVFTKRDSLDVFGRTPLLVACDAYRAIPGEDDNEIIHLLLSACPEAAEVLSIDGETPLHMYCYGRGRHSPNRFTLEALLEAYPDSARLRDDDGNYPVELTFSHLRRGNLDRRELELLIDTFGEDLFTIRDDEGKTVLHRAIDSSQHVDIIRILTSKFKSFLEGNPEGRTLLHYLCATTGLDASDKVDYLNVLLAAAASPETAASARNADGYTPLHVLCTNEELTAEQLKVFTTMEHAVNARGPQGQTPLHVLCSNEAVTVEQFEVFTTMEHAVNARGPQGQTTLHVLCSNNNVSEELLQVLLPTYPELVMAQDNIGQLPLHKMALKFEAVVAKPTFQAALHRLRTAFPSAIHAMDAAGKTPLELACEPPASLNLIHELFSFDPVAVLNSWQEANAEGGE